MAIVKVMTFNLWVDSVDSRDVRSFHNRKAGIVELIQTAAPDIIATQEGTQAMLNELIERLGEAYLLQTFPRTLEPEAEQCAILVKSSKLSIVQSCSFALSKTPHLLGSIGWDATYPRICASLTLRLLANPSQELTIYNTHLDNDGKQAREKSIEIIKETLLEENNPSILLGDFNATLEEEALEQLIADKKIKHYSDDEGVIYDTFHNYGEVSFNQKIDHIFSNQNVSFLSTVVIQTGLEGLLPSDHYPLLAELQI
ncbi:endonuclease/exonuclease/phosphatase family protein [Marinilactibacillus kalidii]|uniref:endonuclease/exonuclease/phosphatase family protein n=1 Tax=Marinilactibacillus kalidii TaxID=2820274 RepID=UPI001ABE4A70|nr:endonuclease/exonuclease/phosphatase family protein [Marinilactibacillus kalidii]